MGNEKIMNWKAANVHRINLLITFLSVALRNISKAKPFLIPHLCIWRDFIRYFAQQNKRSLKFKKHSEDPDVLEYYTLSADK